MKSSIVNVVAFFGSSILFSCSTPKFDIYSVMLENVCNYPVHVNVPNSAQLYRDVDSIDRHLIPGESVEIMGFLCVPGSYWLFPDYNKDLQRCLADNNYILTIANKDGKQLILNTAEFLEAVKKAKLNKGYKYDDFHQWIITDMALCP